MITIPIVALLPIVLFGYGFWILYIRKEPHIGDYGYDLGGVAHVVVWFVGLIAVLMIFGGIYLW